jgi:predicted MFS family arabinose efflux permease
MSVRTAAVQYGYLLGAVVGGAALALGGYRALGVALGGLYVLGAVPHLRGGRADRGEGLPGDALAAPPA